MSTNVLDFVEATVPAGPENMPASMDKPDDITPPFAAPEPEYACQVCGRALTYGGRGPKPKYCNEHKKNAPRTKSGSTTKVAHDRKARLATEHLKTYNALAGTGLMALRMPQTASAIAAKNDAFGEQAYAALILDEKLCDMILKVSGKSGAFSLIMAYAMLLSNVGPTAVMELREQREARADAAAESTIAPQDSPSVLAA